MPAVADGPTDMLRAAEGCRGARFALAGVGTQFAGSLGGIAAGVAAVPQKRIHLSL